MSFGRWILGAVAAGLTMGTVAAEAAPMPLVAAETPAAVQPVQFYFYYGDPPPPVYYDPPPPRYGYGPPPARYYYGPPSHRHYSPPPRRHLGPPAQHSYGRWHGHRPMPPSHVERPRKAQRDRMDTREGRRPQMDRQYNGSKERARSSDRVDWY